MTAPEQRTVTRVDWLLIGLVLSLVLPLRIWLLHNTEVTARDSIGYIRYALQFERDPWTQVLASNHQHPGYPLLVLLMSEPIRAWEGQTTPENMALSTQLVSFFASLLLIVPMYLLGRQFFERAVCVGATLLFQYLPISAQHLSDGVSEPIYLLVVTMALLQGIHAVRSRNVWRCALCGAFAGIAYLIRPEGALVLPALGSVLILMQFRYEWRMSWTHFLACGSAACVGAALFGSIYVYATGKITNKPTGQHILHMVQNAQQHDVCATGSVPLFAATFSKNGGTAVRLQRSIWALLSELNQGFHYLAGIPALLGLWWSIPKLKKDAGFWFLGVYAIIYTTILVALAMVASYVSDRHVLILVLCGSYYSVVGIVEIVCRILRTQPGPEVQGLAPTSRAWWRRAPVWSFLLFAAMIAFCLPKATQRLHGNRKGNHLAGVVLSKQLRLGDIVEDDHNWSHFFAGRVFEEGRDPALPKEAHPNCYVVITRSKDPQIDSERQAAALSQDARPVYFWPENTDVEKARVVVYVQPRSWDRNPWHKIQ